jgi:heme-degrading monooxygenase HmoA
VTVYTLATWHVRPGSEADFVAAWDELSEWTVETGYEWSGTLLRDRNQPTRFVSFGPWPSFHAAERWRTSPGFTERLDRLRELLESVDEPSVYDVVLRVS